MYARFASSCEILLSRPVYSTANLRAKILDLRGFDSSVILISRGEILMSVGSFLESLSQAILVGIILIGRLGVQYEPSCKGLLSEGGESRHNNSYNALYYNNITV